MSWNNLPVWDKNRPIFFQIGMIISLSAANIAINFESLRPDYSDMVFMDDSIFLLTADVQNHTEPPAPKQPEMIKKVDPLLADIITTDEPITEKTESTPDVPNTDLIQELTSGSGTGESEAIPSEPIKLPVTPTLNISEQMPFLASCDRNASEDERRSCTLSTMLTTIYRYLRYPAMARESGVEGTVILTFVIDKNGKMTQLEIIRDIGAGCGDAAAKVLRSLGEWVPGKHNKQAVNVKYTIPIKFKLNS